MNDALCFLDSQMLEQGDVQLCIISTYPTRPLNSFSKNKTGSSPINVHCILVCACTSYFMPCVCKSEDSSVEVLPLLPPSGFPASRSGHEAEIPSLSLADPSSLLGKQIQILTEKKNVGSHKTQVYVYKHTYKHTCTSLNPLVVCVCV